MYCSLEFVKCLFKDSSSVWLSTWLLFQCLLLKIFFLSIYLIIYLNDQLVCDLVDFGKWYMNSEIRQFWLSFYSFIDTCEIRTCNLQNISFAINQHTACHRQSKKKSVDNAPSYFKFTNSHNPNYFLYKLKRSPLI